MQMQVTVISPSEEGFRLWSSRRWIFHAHVRMFHRVPDGTAELANLKAKAAHTWWQTGKQANNYCCCAAFQYQLAGASKHRNGDVSIWCC